MVTSLILRLVTDVYIICKVVQHTDYARNSHVYYTSLQTTFLLMVDLRYNHVNLILSYCH